MDWSEYIDKVDFNEHQRTFNFMVSTGDICLTPNVLDDAHGHDKNKYNRIYEHKMFKAMLWWWQYKIGDVTLKELEKHCKKVLLEKGLDYSSPGDRLEHFIEGHRIYKNGVQSQIIHERSKHFISVLKIFDNPDEIQTTEYYNEKFGDYLNYTILLFYAVECNIN